MYDERKPEPAVSPETDNHTIFYPNDTNADYPRWRRFDKSRTFEGHYQELALYNTGIWNLRWGDNDKRRRQDNLAIFDAIADSLELTEFQHRVGKTQFDQLSLAELSTPGPDGIDVYLVAIVVSALVIQWDAQGRQFKVARSYHPNRTTENNDELFTTLLADFPYSKRTIRSCYQKLQNRVQLFGGSNQQEPRLHSGFRSYA